MTQLNREQAEAVMHRDGPMLVLAGPGSGKTAVLINRVLQLVRAGVDPKGILVLTFSRAAAMEMKSRFDKLAGASCNISFGTFHAIFYHILKSQGLYQNARIITEKKKKELMKLTALRKRIDKGNDPLFVDRMTDLAGLKKSDCIDRVRGVDESELEALSLVYDDYNRIVRKEGYIDFDDMVGDCLKMLKSNDKIRLKWQERFPYILVDEFQDIDRRQYEVLRLLEGDKGNVFCVGDDDQSIYSFRGADPSVMRSFVSDHADASQVRLRVNYRCPGHVIKHAGILIRGNKDRFDKEQIPAVISDDKCIFHACFKNAALEADYICSLIDKIAEERKKAGKRANIGVLYRISRSGDILEEMLKRRGISYKRKDKSRDFYEKDWVKDLIAYLRLSLDLNRNDLARVLNRPERGLVRECLGLDGDIRENMYAYIEDAVYRSVIDKLFADLDFAGGLNCFGAVNYILRGMGLLEWFKKAYRLEDPDDTWEKVTDDFLERVSTYGSIGEFLKMIESRGEADDDTEKETFPGPYPVELTTIHGAKGLEYDDVIMMGLQEGVFPLKKYDDEDSIAEERRLFYVGMTRCRRRLWLTGIKRDDYGKGESRFIKEAGLSDETLGSEGPCVV
ncbi:MAG: ATP-dependent helicase [Lachnospiraceae bacterium]|nr:ATP-dependent helicase [Lachnospiraceae bacterium]